MKNISYLLIFIFSFIFVINVSAYSYVESSQGVIIPKSYDISNINKDWPISSGSYYNYFDPWIYSAGQYWDAGAVKGTYLNISADYYFGIKGEAYSDAEFSNHLSSAKNTLTASNLVCGIGNIRQGYDSTFSKQITNFNVTYNVTYPDSGGWQVLYHITFNYSQQIKEVNKNSTNMWCVFDRNPSSGLFFQPVANSSNSSIRYYYYNYRFDYSVTSDATAGAINDLNSSVDETNDKLDQTNEELGEMNDYIQDDTPASTEDVDLDSLGTVSGLLPAGPLDSLLNIPFTFLSVLTSSMSGTCVPITGTFVFDSTLSIPCFDSFYDDVPDYLMNFINLIPAGFILIMYFKHLYKKIERAVSLETTVDDEWGVI